MGDSAAQLNSMLGARKPVGARVGGRRWLRSLPKQKPKIPGPFGLISKLERCCEQDLLPYHR
jgi:hypothetical protein